VLSNFPLPEPVLVALAAAAAWGLARGARCRASGPRRFLGGALVAVGGAVVARSWDAAGTVTLSNPERVLAEGPYGVSRNPMYEGWLLVHAGIATWCGSPAALIGVPVAAAVLHREVHREETRLLGELGVEYRAYLEDVPRYGLLRVPWG
jgi:protein-S-isoprenylcysteine O-methyltransferase Ste14